MSLQDDIFDLQDYLEDGASPSDKGMLRTFNGIIEYINIIEADNQEMKAQVGALSKVLIVNNGFRITEAGALHCKYIHITIDGTEK